MGTGQGSGRPKLDNVQTTAKRRETGKATLTMVLVANEKTDTDRVRLSVDSLPWFALPPLRPHRLREREI